jgi:uncharacterized alkaline shock family protein YloU
MLGLFDGRIAMPNNIPGDLHISNDVLADLAGAAALECYGVVGVCAPSAMDGFAKLLPASRLRRGVVVRQGEEGIHVNLYIIIEHGTNISTVCKNLVDQVTFVLEDYASVKVDAVEVKVEGVRVR